MKGLFLEIYYKNKRQVYITNLTLSLIWLIMVYFIDSQLMIYLYILMIFCANSLFVLLSQRKDYDLKLYKYEKILPLEFKYVILSKYLSQLFMIFLSMLVSAVLIYISILLGRTYFDFSFADVLTLLSIIIALVLQMTSVFYLGLYKIDFEKGDLWLILGIIISIALLFVEMFALNTFEVSKGMGNIVLIIISGLMITVSYFVCVGKIFVSEKTRTVKQVR